MAITKADVVEYYITQRGVASSEEGVKVLRAVDRILNKIWELHQGQWHWQFMETRDVSIIISGSSGYFDYWATGIKMAVVTSLRNNNTERTVLVPSEPVPLSIIDALREIATRTATIDMIIFGNAGGKIYPYPAGTAASTILVTGLLDAYQNTIAMPSGQEAAIVELIDYELGKSPDLSKYKQQCLRLGAKPIVDWWGQKYGIDVS